MVAATSSLPATTLPSYTLKGFPLIVAPYKEVNTQVNKICIMVSIPGGATDVKVTLNEEGTEAIINFHWPRSMHDMQEAFKYFFEAKMMTIQDPRIGAVMEQLPQYRAKTNQAPECVVKIDLPFRVQTTPASWENYGIKRPDGTKITVIDLTGYLSAYSLKDDAVTFDM